MHNDPQKISSIEWKEICTLPEIREGWGLGEDGNHEDFASMVYGVKFNFTSGSPGYCGDLFMIQGDSLSGEAPWVLIRGKGGMLTFANDEPYRN